MTTNTPAGSWTAIATANDPLAGDAFVESLAAAGGPSVFHFGVRNRLLPRGDCARQEAGRPTLKLIPVTYEHAALNNGIAKDVPMLESYRGVVPFLISDFIRIGLILAFPGIALLGVQIFTS